MRIAHLVAIALLLGGTAEAAPKQLSFKQRVAKAKKSLKANADKMFAEIRAQQQAGVSDATARALSGWLAPAFSFGLCQAYLRQGDLPDWYAKFDAIPFGFGDGAAQARAGYRLQGQQARQEGTQSTMLAELMDGEKAATCAAELEGARQFLRDM